MEAVNDKADIAVGTNHVFRLIWKSAPSSAVRRGFSTSWVHLYPAQKTYRVTPRGCQWPVANGANCLWSAPTLCRGTLPNG
jgi:hypothetical protein